MSEEESTESVFSPEDQVPDAEPESDLAAEVQDLAVKLKSAVLAAAELQVQVRFVRRLVHRRADALMFLDRRELDTLFRVRDDTRRIDEFLKCVRYNDRSIRDVLGRYARPRRR
jgi:hypothetical protein